MKSAKTQPKARQYLDRLAAGGRCHFSSTEARTNADDAVVLLPARARNARRDETWKLIVNVKVEPHL